MYCLTLHQPWGGAIFYADASRKTVENRSWDTAYRGELAIHVGRRYAEDFEAKLQRCRVKKSSIRSATERRMVTSAVIGVVELYDVVQDDPSPWATVGMYHFRLRNPRLLATPVETPGRMGLWRPSPTVAERILKQL